MSYIISLLVFVFIAWLILRSINKMFGEKKRFVIMSPFKAKITYKGKAIKNTKVKLNYSWNTDSKNSYEGYDEYFMTDENGVVEMPAITRKIFVSNIQPTVSNYCIEVGHEGEFIEILSVAKEDPKMHGELGQPLSDLRCELTDAFYAVLDPAEKSLYGSRCNWKERMLFEIIEQ